MHYQRILNLYWKKEELEGCKKKSRRQTETQSWKRESNEKKADLSPGS